MTCFFQHIIVTNSTIIQSLSWHVDCVITAAKAVRMSMIGNNQFMSRYKGKRCRRFGVVFFLAVFFLPAAMAHACESQSHNVPHAAANSASTHGHPTGPRDARGDLCKFIRDQVSAWEDSSTGLDLSTGVKQPAAGLDSQVAIPELILFLSL